jgi:abhydrolase domain-containing protein 12
VPENQVQPFSITTPDGQVLFAWHILPLALYTKHEALLTQEPAGLAEKIENTAAFRLLVTDPESRLVIYCQ